MSAKLVNGSAGMSLSKVTFFRNLVEVFIRYYRATSTDNAEAKLSSFTSLFNLTG